MADAASCLCGAETAVLITSNPGRIRKLVIDVHGHELRVLARGALRCEACSRVFAAWVWLGTPTLPVAEVISLRGLPSPVGNVPESNTALERCEWYEEPEDRN